METRKLVAQNKRKIVHTKAGVRDSRSPFTAKSVLLSGGFFIGALVYWIVGGDKDATGSWLQQAAPGIMTITGSYLGGFFIGWGARRAIKTTSILAAILLAVTGLFISWGWDGATVQSWVNSSTELFGQNVEEAGHYLVSLLPSATAGGIGGVLGFKRK